MPDKKCSQCHTSYSDPASAFHRDKHRRDGYRNLCKACVRAYNATPVRQDADKARLATYRAAHLDEVRAYGRTYQANRRAEALNEELRNLAARK